MKSTVLVGLAWAVSFGAGCAAEAGVTPSQEGEMSEIADAVASATDLPPDVARALTSNRSIPPALLNRLFQIEHQVPIAPGRSIHVTETFSLRGWLRWPHRGLLMLPGPLVKGDFYNIEVDGYRGRDLIAARGFFAFSVDFEGSGMSSYPVDGRSPSQEIQIGAMRTVIQSLERQRLIPKMDILGESWGGGVAAELCADRVRVKSCTLASMLYKTPSDFANMTFRSPGFRAFLDALPDGYFTTVPETYDPIVANSPPEVQAWTRENEPATYMTVPLYDVFDLPFFDPTAARVPGRVIQGEVDPNQSLDDARELARDYDSHGAELVVISGGGHIPRVEAQPNSSLYWRAVVEFIDP